MNIQRPLRRLPREDVWNPTIEDFTRLALTRIAFFHAPDAENPPPRLYPLAERMRGEFFTSEDWDEYGDLETERARLTYTLSTCTTRGPPSVSESVLQHVLSQASVLEVWPAAEPALRKHATESLEYVLKTQSASDPTSVQEGLNTKAGYLIVPADYRTSRSATDLSLQLWKRSLSETAGKLADGPLTAAVTASFLQIYAYLKDPVYGLKKSLKVQQVHFVNLLNKLRAGVNGGFAPSLEDWELIAAQAAHESTFLSCPLLHQAILVHFQAHHQLVYSNILLNSLARAEFSLPSHVLEVAEELLRAVVANNGEACPVVPILVTVRPSFANEGEYVIPIIDGNHRATASMLLRFLANRPLATDFLAMSQNLLEYCRKNGLGKKWEIDLVDVLRELYEESNKQFHRFILDNYESVQKFAPVKHIPALVVLEEDFFTICKQRSVGRPDPVILLPFHQTLLNDDTLRFALPQKAGQTHGRPGAFRLLSLSPFGSDESGSKINENRTFLADLRQSLVGLPT